MTPTFKEYLEAAKRKGLDMVAIEKKYAKIQDKFNQNKVHYLNILDVGKYHLVQVSNGHVTGDDIVNKITAKNVLDSGKVVGNQQLASAMKSDF